MGTHHNACRPAFSPDARLAGCNTLRLVSLTPDRPDRDPPPPRLQKVLRVRSSSSRRIRRQRNLPISRTRQSCANRYTGLHCRRQTRSSRSNCSRTVTLRAFHAGQIPGAAQAPRLFRRPAAPWVGARSARVHLWGDRINQDLRHELTHALLTTASSRTSRSWLMRAGRVFTKCDGWNGVNPEHLKHLRGASEQAVPSDLGPPGGVQRSAADERRRSTRGLAWVYLMLAQRAQAKRVLVGYCANCGNNSKPGPLRPRLATVYSSLTPPWSRTLANRRRQAPASTAQR